MLKNVLLVGIGGSIGSMLRYIVAWYITSTAFPLATWLVNILGSFLIGLLMAWILKNSAEQLSYKLLLVTGFCGGFTTLSAFSWDVLLLLQQQRFILATLYVLATIILAILATWLGFTLIK
ncbi:MAG TPA: fluoride efflux transporter CrcB [Chitinophagaceae bacterium]|jgi:CrcB protein|nr:fluoride efflux transporter CrcB [Chitinophagaceae bacterium]MBP9741492.1 fluoride efflux transporter CrcB [Chitinophagaceae bacterium]HPH23137.1 fluoride efflux transporter CrcB [Chitinophagaceae bacterium]